MVKHSTYLEIEVKHYIPEHELFRKKSAEDSLEGPEHPCMIGSATERSLTCKGHIFSLDDLSSQCKFRLRVW